MKHPLDRGAGPGEQLQEEMNPVNSLLHNLLCVLSSKKQALSQIGSVCLLSVGFC